VPRRARSNTERKTPFDDTLPPAYPFIYAHALHAGRPVLLYSGAGVWVAREGLLHPPGADWVGFFFLTHLFLRAAVAFRP
jgi:hypothetical protein